MFIYIKYIINIHEYTIIKHRVWICELKFINHDLDSQTINIQLKNKNPVRSFNYSKL